MHRSLVTLLVLASLLLGASATAASFTRLDDRRFVYSESVPPSGESFCGQRTPSQPFAAWQGSVGCISGDAYQDSQATVDQLSGVLDVSTTGGGSDVDVRSVYEIDFSVASATPYELQLDLSHFFFEGSFDESEPNPDTGASVRLLRSGVPVFEYDATFEATAYPPPDDDFYTFTAQDPTFVFHTGVLDPGEIYTFFAEIRSFQQTGAEGTLEVSLLAVPEPATGALLGLALACLAVHRRASR